VGCNDALIVNGEGVEFIVAAASPRPHPKGD